MPFVKMLGLAWQVHGLLSGYFIVDEINLDVSLQLVEVILKAQ